MEYINKIDLSTQAKLLSGNTATFGGSIKLSENLTIDGKVKFTGLGNITGNTTMLVVDETGSISKTKLLILNEADLISNSETALATQKSIKTYVDNTVSSIGMLQGGFDATSTTFPSTENIGKGDYWYVTVAGTIQGEKLNVGDVIIANENNPSSTSTGDWIFLESNRDQATFDALGLIRIATDDEVAAGTISDKAVTPATLKNLLDIRIHESTNYLTFVGLELPTSLFNVTSNVAIPSASTLSASFKTQLKNTVFAAPEIENGLPVFRTLSSADIPDLSWNKILSGSTPNTLAGYGIIDGQTKLQADASYIKSQAGSYQNANFKISGTGTTSFMVVESGLTIYKTPTKPLDAVRLQDLSGLTSSTRFGVAGEDSNATQYRYMDMANNSFQIQNISYLDIMAGASTHWAKLYLDSESGYGQVRASNPEGNSYLAVDGENLFLYAKDALGTGGAITEALFGMEPGEAWGGFSTFRFQAKRANGETSNIYLPYKANNTSESPRHIIPLSVNNQVADIYGNITIATSNSSGTVTSVGMTAPTGLNITPATITTSGTFALSLQSGYSIPTTASQTNWNTAYTSSHDKTKLWSTSHPNDFYIQNTWDGTYWQVTSNHGSSVNVGRATNAGYADSAGNATSVNSQSFAWSNNDNNPTWLWGANTSGSAFLVHRPSMSVNYANSAGSATSATNANYATSAGNTDTVDGYHASSFIINGGSGDWQIASNSTSTDYSTASLELREANFTGSGSIAPRLGFHWGGVVASQIGLQSDGTIAILNNPGSNYENFRANNATFAGYVTATGGAGTSDRRYKNIKTFNFDLKQLDNLEIYQFEWNEKIPDENGRQHYGWIAQEVEEINPNLIMGDEDKLALNKEELLILEVKRLKERLLEMDERLKKLGV